MILEKALQQLGLSEKEIIVYLSILELSRGTALQISRETNLKRPTVYVNLESLIQKKLIHKVPKGTTTLYVAEDPSNILESLREREKTIENIIPLLKAVYSVRKNKPQIRFYEGKDGVRKIYTELRRAKKYILFYGSLKDVTKGYSDVMLNYRVVKKMGITVKEIMSSQPFDKKYAQEIKNFGNPKHTVRLLKENTFFPLDSAIVDDTKLVFMSLEGSHFGLVIESKDIAQSYKMLYELAWQSAKKI